MRVQRQKAAVLAGVALAALAALVPLAPAAAQAVSGARPAAARSVATGQLVLHLRVTGAYQYSGTLRKAIDKNGTGCFAGKSGKSLAYAVIYNAPGFSSTGASTGVVFEAGVLPYRSGSMSPYRGNKVVAIVFATKGMTYQAGNGQAAAAASLELSVTAGGRHGSFTGTRIPAKNRKGSVSIWATWSCPSVLTPPSA